MPTVVRCESLVAAEEVKALFGRNGLDGVIERYDRVYGAAFAQGASSWLYRRDDGMVVGHIAAVPRCFKIGGTDVVGGLLTDLVFDADQRNLFPALAMVRQLVRDLRASGKYAFLWGDPTRPAEVVMRLVGFGAQGHLTRFVLPLASAYLWTVRVLRGIRPARGVWLTGPEADRRCLAVANRLETERFAPDRQPDTYLPRLGLPRLRERRWVEIRASGSNEPTAVALVARTLDTLHMFDLRWNARETSVADVVHAVANGARREGCLKLDVCTLEGSGLAAELGRAGFFRREAVLPLHVLPLADVVLPPVVEWMWLPLDGSTW
jgi:hypothetical protein